MNLLHHEFVQRRRSTAGAIPLIDVVFLLLIFFIAAGIRRDAADLPLFLPEAPGVAAHIRPGDEEFYRRAHLRVSIEAGRAWYHLDDGRDVLLSAEIPVLRQRLEHLVAEDERPVLVSIDDAPGVSVEHVARAIGACRQAGVDSVSLTAPRD